MHAKILKQVVIAFAVTVLGALPCMAQDKLDKGEAKQIAEEAFIYGFPMVMNYTVFYEYFVDKSGPQYKAPPNQLYNTARVYTPKDTAIVTPNSDTPYSFVAMDLRAEPFVVCNPEIEKSRYFSIQLVDMYTFNYGYMGSRTTGNGAGCYLIAGPSWKGEKPEGVGKVFRSETDFSFAIIRTQLFNPADIDNVKKIQAQYTAQPLSQFLKQPAPAALPLPDFPKFTEAAFKTDAFSYLNFLLQFCPAVDLLERELNLGILGGHGPLADQRVEGGEVVRHAMRGFAQLQGLLGALLFELLISLGCLSEGAAHLVEHQDRADGERDIELDLNEIEGAS